MVDLHNLHERAQRFVVGVVLAAETARKEDAGPGGLLFTMIDELNKYAPREGTSPIKEVLLDIAERGRSLGIILIGAQQTASEVERRIVSNSAIRVVGRLDSAEAGRPEYGFLPASQRTRATLAKPGAMFVSQPEIPVPLAVEFPFPAWATRLSECAAPPPRSPATPQADAFARLPPWTTTTSRRSDVIETKERTVMRFMHTADWHVGKVLKGRDRLDEQREVLAEIAAIAEQNEVDAVLIAGDIYEHAAPSAAAQNLVIQTLLRLRRAGAEVIAIAGNHDHGPTFEAYRPLMGVAGITLVGAVHRPDRGGVVRFRARWTARTSRWRCCRSSPRATPCGPPRSSRRPRRRTSVPTTRWCARSSGALTAGFGPDTVNLVMSHLTCVNGTFGGGERSAQSIFEYSVPATLFPVSAHYVALGHLAIRN